MSVQTPPARVLIVDDHPVVRDGIASRIAPLPDMEICGEADSEAQAMRSVEELLPDLVIVDISLAGGDGLELTRRIHSSYPTIAILIHSMYEESIYGERAIQAGALGYVEKRASRGNLVAAMRSVLAGTPFLSSELTTRIVRRRAGRHEEDPQLGVESLSDRELQVLRLIGRGLTTRQVAEELHLSVNTIDTYRQKIKTKLDLTTGAELGRFAAQWALQNS